MSRITNPKNKKALTAFHYIETTIELTNLSGKKAYEYSNFFGINFNNKNIEKKLIKHKIDQEEYKSYLRKLPMFIKNNGLLNTLTFIFAKSKAKGSSFKEVLSKLNDSNQNNNQENKEIKINYNTYDQIGCQINDWILDHPAFPELNPKVYLDLVKFVTESDSKQYRNLTFEILSLLGWMKRYAEGMIYNEE